MKIKAIKYENNIDTLRGISILLVVIYHLKIQIFETTLLSGGYLGVDIFFVISGYLITSILFLNTKDKKFNWKLFFQKRFLRIFPVYIIAIFLTILCSYFILIPKQLMMLAESAGSSILFISNIFFWKYLNNYWLPDANLNPLLHTWSLSIEIQYYICFSMFFIILKKYDLNFKISLIITGLSSLVISILLSFIEPQINFFGFQSRYWEFVLGSFVFLYKDKINLSLNLYYKYLIYFIIIIFAILFNETTKHPSFFTLLFLIIISIFILNKKQYKNFYDDKILKFLGLISYSLYIWHYPIISILQRIFIENSNYLKVFMFFISIFISTISYHFIEKKLKKNIKKGFYFIYIFIFLSLFLIISIIKNDGYHERLKLSSFYKEATSQTIGYNYYFKNNHFSHFSNNNFLVLGNSHSTLTYQGFNGNRHLYKDMNFSNFHIQVSCFNEPALKNTRDICKGVLDKLENRRYLKSLNDFKNSNVIIISTRWTNEDLAALPEFVGFLKKYNKKIIILNSISDMNQIDNINNIENRSLSLLEKNYLKKKFPYQKFLYLNNNHASELILEKFQNLYFLNKSKQSDLMNNKLKKIAKELEVSFLDIESFNCNSLSKKCRVITDDNKLIMHDSTGHLTNNGAIYLFNLIYNDFVQIINNDIY